HLPLEQAQLLRVAAVVGLEFSTPVLAELSGSDHVEELLRALRHEDLIYATSDVDTFRFKHGVARDVIYETVLRAERRRLHGAVAHLIAQSVAANSNSDQSESLAYHYAGSDDHARAAMYSALAGEKALQQSSLDRARFHFAAALAALDKLPQDRETKQRWLDLSMRWAEPSAYSPRRENIQVMERAARLGAELGDVNAQCRSGYWLGWFYFVLGDYANSIEAHQRALDFASAANDHRMVAQLWSNLGQVYGAAGEYTEALPLLTRGLESKKNRGQSQSLTRAVGYAHAMACKGLLHSDRGEFDLVDQHFGEALEVVQGSNHPMEASILSQQCLALLRRGEWSLCVEASQRSMHAAERKGIPFLVAQSRFFHGFARFMQEPNHLWIERMRRALDWLDLMEQGLYSSFLYACTADAYLSLGETEVAAEFSGRALRRVDKRDLLGEAAGYRVQARLSSLQEGTTAEQTDASLMRAFRAAEARKSPREHVLTNLLQAELWLERGEHERAYFAAEAARSEFTRMQMS
ncbi:MAG TPA: tetratricopeptide repeat protein, partial [Polyangiales bacterium]|nr:tetratricopeptide repeat protein [Polyangiales bacterium]